MTELWKDVTGYEGLYQVSNLGRVRSLDHESKTVRNGITFIIPKKGKVLSPLTRQHGYLAVMLYGRGGHKRGFKTASIHRLVAEAFIENPNGYDEVNHLDECKTNNCVDNLEWCDRKYNTNYGTAQQRRTERAINNPQRSKRVAQMDMQGNVLREFPSLSEVRRQLGYSPANISNCCNHHPNYSHAYGYKWEYITT